jgi:type IV secretory pathway TrbF-like protein
MNKPISKILILQIAVDANGVLQTTNSTSNINYREKAFGINSNNKVALATDNNLNVIIT